MQFFRELDEKKTADKTENFLDYKLPQFIEQTGYLLPDLASPKWSSMPKSPNAINSREDNLLEAIEIDRIMRAIHQTIYHCSSISKIILISLFIKRNSVEQTMRLLPYEKTRYYKRLKPKALIEFANKYHYYENQNGVDDDNFIELRIFKKQHSEEF
ncbi:ArpU family transcriptional regulator [Lactobacillus sp. ESL0731]|uniref:ArpU family phage packaging/lysis transcriptional regulator n=1 Tax=unclassified Lactobacillus TaxID=2620435 RepID=UPI0023F99B61|nr:MULTISPECIES: ArpU family phage packaging/lysis transcriptional regulator [unclassified Lactobacillus]WEV51661.1 ArpU family transcriptional regulator [Lactobacillus sp. ESL0700]WEV62790.1 ArpU family transcriptional regulator [Lactobacillus sp. ESL0731]